MNDVTSFSRLGQALEDAEKAKQSAKFCLEGERFNDMVSRTKIVIDKANFANGEGHLQSAINEVLKDRVDAMFTEALGLLEQKEMTARDALEAALKPRSRKSAAA